MDQWSHLEELQLMKFAWQKNLVDIAAWNSQQVKDVEVDTEFQDFCHEEEDCKLWDREDREFFDWES